MSRTIRNLVAVGSAMLLSVSLALPALAWEPDVSVSGTTVSAQKSCNTAVAVQSGAAISGPAVVNGNGEAESGDASVELSGHQSQTNVQVAVGAAVGVGAIGEKIAVSADTTNAQQASNWAGMEQSAAAVTGQAETAGTVKDADDAAEAETGDASVEIEASQHQTNIQASANVAAALGVLAFDEPIKVAASGVAAQQSDQTAMITQDGAAITGTAFASGKEAEATSGDAETELEAHQRQLTVQLIANVAVPILSADTDVMSDSVAAQSNWTAADIAQSGASETFPAQTMGDEGESTSGDAETELEQSQHQKTIQAALSINGTFLTW
jgi:hypothetical protein